MGQLKKNKKNKKLDHQRVQNAPFRVICSETQCEIPEGGTDPTGSWRTHPTWSYLGLVPLPLSHLVRT